MYTVTVAACSLSQVYMPIVECESTVIGCLNTSKVNILQECTFPIDAGATVALIYGKHIQVMKNIHILRSVHVHV